MQVQLARLLRYNVTWLEEGGSPPGDRATRWLFAICALLELPLPADTCATLRSLLRACSLPPEPQGPPEASHAGEGGREPDQASAGPVRVGEGPGGLAPEGRGPGGHGEAGHARGEPDLASGARGVPDQARLRAQARVHVLVAIAGAYFKQDESLARAGQFLQL